MPASTRIVVTALSIGGVSFVAGFFGPIVFTPDANLGPLLGIFVTGPVGLFLGALIGIVWSARRAEGEDLQVEIGWLCVIWSLALLNYLFFARLAGGVLVLPAVGVQVAAVMAGCALLVIGKGRLTIAGATRRRRNTLVVAAAAMAAMALFPPVEAEAIDPSSTPQFTFFLDGGFDASEHIPLYVIDVGQLIIQWAVVAVIAVVLCFSVSGEAKTSAKA